MENIAPLCYNCIENNNKVITVNSIRKHSIKTDIEWSFDNHCKVREELSSRGIDPDDFTINTDIDENEDDRIVITISFNNEADFMLTSIAGLGGGIK